MFSDQELAYLGSQRLARIATVSADSQPDVAPVGFEFDGKRFYVGGVNLARTAKYKNVRANPRVALVIDDLASADPWTPRGIKIHGSARIVNHQGRLGAGEYLEIAAATHWSWGIEGPVFRDGKPVIKKARHP